MRKVICGVVVVLVVVVAYRIIVSAPVPLLWTLDFVYTLLSEAFEVKLDKNVNDDMKWLPLYHRILCLLQSRPLKDCFETLLLAKDHSHRLQT